jgi:hypothetical protein
LSPGNVESLILYKVNLHFNANLIEVTILEERRTTIVLRNTNTAEDLLFILAFAEANNESASIAGQPGRYVA